MSDQEKLKPMEGQKDLERRERLHEFFKQSPAIWHDIIEDLKIVWHNESVQLKSRNPANRDYSAGYVAAYESVLDMERYFTKQWKNQTMQGQQKVLAP